VPGPSDDPLVSRPAELTHGAVRCGAVRCGAVRCGAVRCGAVRCGAVNSCHRWPSFQEHRTSPVTHCRITQWEKTVASVQVHGGFHDSSKIQSASASSSDHPIGDRPSRHRCRLPSAGRRDLVGAPARKHAEDLDELGGRSRFLKSGDSSVLCQCFVGHATHERSSHLRPRTNGRQLFIRCPHNTRVTPNPPIVTQESERK
jgi:hypothetical protein